MTTASSAPRPVVLMILDGWGLRESKVGNAVEAANLPTYRRLLKEYPNTKLEASGLAVGLPAGIMGNSEVGHLTIGSGRVNFQELPRINIAIDKGDYAKSPVLVKLAHDTHQRIGRMHVMGLTSDGGVHSAEKHYFGALAAFKQLGFGERNDLWFHVFLDGRDTPPRSGLDYVQRLEAEMKRIGVGRIATVQGRYWAMDRDKRWERTAVAYDALVHGKGLRFNSATEAIKAAYDGAENNTDEFVTPRIIVPAGKLHPGDGVLHFNYRADRTRQLSAALVHTEFEPKKSNVDGKEFVWNRGPYPRIDFVATTHYDDTLPVPEVFPQQEITNTLGETLSKAGKVQFRISETEKYAHVTYFLNGGVEKQFPGEERALIPSPKVATYDLQPQMSCEKLTETVLEAVNSKRFDFIMMNFPNPDMVGHTGVFKAVVKALEAMDPCVGRIVDAVLAQDGALVITADHGNAEQMFHDNMPAEFIGKDTDLVPKEFRHTQHTTNLVPCIYVQKGAATKALRPQGGLIDLAPTVLELMGVGAPKEMTGTSLIVK